MCQVYENYFNPFITLVRREREGKLFLSWVINTKPDKQIYQVLIIVICVQKSSDIKYMIIVLITVLTWRELYADSAKANTWGASVPNALPL